MTVYDDVADLVDLIDTNWNTANTNGVKPNIGKIIDYPKELSFMDNKGYVLLYSLVEVEELPGLGLQTFADVSETVKIDIRVFEDEDYFKLVKAELKRILYSNRASGTANSCILDLDNKNITNLSDRSRKYYREVREVTVVAIGRDMVN